MSNPSQYYKEWELDYIKNNYTSQTDEQIAQHLGRNNAPSIKRKRHRMGLILTNEEKYNRIQYAQTTRWKNNVKLKRYCLWCGADITNKKSGQITCNYKCSSLYRKRILKPHCKNWWTKEELQYIRDNYLKLTQRQIAVNIGRSKYSVKSRYKILGLKVPKDNRYFKIANCVDRKIFKHSDEHLAMLKERMTVIRANDPKVKNGTVAQQGKYLKIKISNGRWDFYERHVWEKYYGKIPTHHKIIFNDKNRLNCNINNLSCVSYEYDMVTQRKTLTDGYVLKQIEKENKQLRDKILKEYPELIVLKRQNIKIRREIRQNKKPTG